MLNIFDGEIIRKTLLDFNLAEHYVDGIMDEIERRLQLEDVKQSLTEALRKHKLTDVMLSIVRQTSDDDEHKLDMPPTTIGPSLYVQYPTNPRVQPYNHDRSTL